MVIERNRPTTPSCIVRPKVLNPFLKADHRRSFLESFVVMLLRAFIAGPYMILSGTLCLVAGGTAAFTVILLANPVAAVVGYPQWVGMVFLMIAAVTGFTVGAFVQDKLEPEWTPSWMSLSLE